MLDRVNSTETVELPTSMGTARDPCWKPRVKQHQGRKEKKKQNCGNASRKRGATMAFFASSLPFCRVRLNWQHFFTRIRLAPFATRVKASRLKKRREERERTKKCLGVKRLKEEVWAKQRLQLREPFLFGLK